MAHNKGHKNQMRRLHVVTGILIAICHSPINAKEPTTASDLLISNLSKCVKHHSSASTLMDGIAEKDKLISAEYSRFVAFDRQLNRLNTQKNFAIADLEKTPHSKPMQKSVEFYVEKSMAMEELREEKVVAVFEHMYGRERKSDKLKKYMAILESCKQLTYTPQARARVCSMPVNSNSKWCKMAF